MVHSPNQLLAAMPDELFKAMQPHLRSIELKRGDVVAAPGGVVRHVIFPHSGIVSLVVELSIGEMVETAMIGRDGVVNAVCALDGKISLNKGIVQLEGEASVILPERLNAIADQNAPLRSLLLRHEQVLFAQAQQSAACNASHFVEARMCRWLLRTRDLAGSDDLFITQEFLAQMLGVRRTSVSLVANTLQKAGFIRYRRGHVRILDVAALTEAACECYETLNGHFDWLLRATNFSEK